MRIIAAAATLCLLNVTAFAKPPTDNSPAISRTEIEAGLQAHDHALYIKKGWIRDPYITLGPDKFYYLTGTTPNPDGTSETGDSYNTGLGKSSIVGSAVQIWRSKDLIDWKYLGAPFTLKDSWHATQPGGAGKYVWAPEIHWLGDRWALVHCPAKYADLALTAGPELKGPWTLPMGEQLGKKHDPSLFKDDDGTWWMIWAATDIAPLKSDFSAFTAPAKHIAPANRKIGHEGCTILKINGKYVLFGTGWSTDQMRKGSYNLYYATADKVTGPYGPRKFVGRFLGHGTPFQTRDGQWWCTAFYNANVPPVPRKGIETRDLSETAQTINQLGTTIVPLEVKTLANGDVNIHAIDPAYATPGPDEVQKFDL